MKCKHVFNEMGLCDHCGRIRHFIDEIICPYCSNTFETDNNSEYCERCTDEIKKLEGDRLRFMQP